MDRANASLLNEVPGKSGQSHAFGGTVCIWKRTGRAINGILFRVEIFFFFHPRNRTKERSADQGAYFPNNLSVKVIFLFFGLIYFLEYCTKYRPVYELQLQLFWLINNFVSGRFPF